MSGPGSVWCACLIGAALCLSRPAAAQPAPSAAPAAEPVPAPVPEPVPESAPAAEPVPEPAPAAESAPAAEPVPAGPPPPPTFTQLGEPAPPPLPPAAEKAPTTPGEWKAQDLGENRHDGFMIRISLGFGWGTSSSDRLEYSGVGSPYSIALGYSVIENLELVVDFFGAGMLGANVAIDGAPSQDTEIDARTSGMGLGATYYLMPINLYVSAAFGIGWHSFDAPHGGAQVSKPGFALDAILGKEFWVGEQWGIGAGFQFVLVQSGDDYDGSLVGMGFGGLVSATYN